MAPHPALDLRDLESKLATETGLAEVITIRGNGRPLVSVINAGFVGHPATGEPVVAFVARGPSARLVHLRRDARITLVARRGWTWAAVDGTAELAGPDDPHAAVPAEDLPGLLRQIFRAAGGTHDDYDEYDQAMVDDRRCAVLITPTRTYGNSPGQ